MNHVRRVVPLFALMESNFAISWVSNTLRLMVKIMIRLEFSVDEYCSIAFASVIPMATPVGTAQRSFTLKIKCAIRHVIAAAVSEKAKVMNNVSVNSMWFSHVTCLMFAFFLGSKHCYRQDCRQDIK